MKKYRLCTNNYLEEEVSIWREITDKTSEEYIFSQDNYFISRDGILVRGRE